LVDQRSGENDTPRLPGVKAGAIVNWLKADFQLGHGHAMAPITQRKETSFEPAIREFLERKLGGLTKCNNYF
jgi:Domain of unknown function (DUF4287)